MQCLGMGSRLLHQVLGEVEQAGRAEGQRQDHLLRHALLAAEEVVKVFLQATAHLPQAIIQQQQEIVPMPA